MACRTTRLGGICTGLIKWLERLFVTTASGGSGPGAAHCEGPPTAIIGPFLTPINFSAYQMPGSKRFGPFF